MSLKLAAQFSGGPGAQSLSCRSQPLCALGFSLVSSEKEEIGFFSSILGLSFEKAPSAGSLSLQNPPFTNPQEHMVDSIVPTSSSGSVWLCALK